MPFKPDLPDRGGWTDGALDAPWQGFALCTEQDVAAYLADNAPQLLNRFAELLETQ